MLVRMKVNILKQPLKMAANGINIVVEFCALD